MNNSDRRSGTLITLVVKTLTHGETKYASFSSIPVFRDKIVDMFLACFLNDKFRQV